MKEQDFKYILDRSESSILDFKSKMYDFENNKEKSIADFMKDVICFSNTIRNQPGYIVIGVEEKDNGEKVLHGLDKNIDDAILQDKVKDKVFPRPIFSFYKVQYDSKEYGVFEFPVVKYQVPLYPTVKVKGLEIGRIYFRKGTSNSEAIGLEIIRINDWLKSLSQEENDVSLSQKVTNFMIRLTEGKEKISVILSDLFGFAQKHKLDEIAKFCTSELKGYSSNELNLAPRIYKYRAQKVFMSLHKIDINPYSYKTITDSAIKKEMEEHKDFFETNLLFSHSILEIEKSIEKLCQNGNISFGTMTLNSKQVFPKDKTKDYQIIIYAFKDDYINLYQNIRQKTLEYLMTI